MLKRIFLVLAGLLVGLMGAYLVASNISKKRVAAQLQETVAESDLIESLTYGKLSTGLLSSSVRLADLDLRLKGIEDPVTIGEMQVNDIVLQDDFPVAADLWVEGLRLHARHSLLAPWHEALSSLGYDGVDISLRLRYLYDPAQRKFALEQCELSEPRMGRLQLDLALHNINLAPFLAHDYRESPLAALGAFSLISLAGLDADYQDKSLARSFIDHQARQAGMSSGQYVDGLVADLNQRSGDAAEAPVREALEAVARFLRDPDRITVKAAPQTAVALMRLFLINDVGDVFDQLNLHVSS